MTDPILDPLRRPTEHRPECPAVPTAPLRSYPHAAYVRDCNCWLRSTGPTWDDCDDVITEIESLRAVVRWVGNGWFGDLADDIALDLDDECAAAVRRALEDRP